MGGVWSKKGFFIRVNSSLTLKRDKGVNHLHKGLLQTVKGAF